MPKKPVKKAAPKKPSKAFRKIAAGLKDALKIEKTRHVSENEIHMKCWQWVCVTHSALLIFHVANESEAPVQYRVKLKRKGLLPGVADFLAFPLSGRKASIELKDDKNDQSADQIKFQKRWERSGGVYYLVRSFEEFQSVVNALVLFG